MGLLSSWLNKNGISRDEMRLKARSKLFGFIQWFCGEFGWVLYLIGVLALVALPHPKFHEDAQNDEKALLTGQVTRYFDWSDSRYVLNRQMNESIWSDQDSSARIEFVRKEFDSLGLDVAIQKFSWMNGLKKQSGTNIHGILRGPRADGAESIVLACPWWFNKDTPNSSCIKFLITFAAFASKYSYWSKDLVFLVTDEPFGSYAWLQAYHGFLPDDNGNIEYEGLSSHAGLIISSISLELGNTETVSIMGLFPEGLDGRLSNADLITTVVRSFQYEHIPLTLHEDPAPVPDHFPWFERYQRYAYSTLKYIQYQALGSSGSHHSVFPKYNVESLTFRAIQEEGHSSIDFQRLGRAVETSVRSLNNLLERFHHSFWFYLMPAVDKYLLLSIYIVPTIVVAVPLALKSLALWWRLGSSQQRDTSISIDNYVLATSIPFTASPRPVYPALMTFGVAHVSGLAILDFATRYHHYLAISTSSELMIGVLLLLQPAIVFLLKVGIWNPADKHAKEVLRCFLYAEMGLLIISLSVLNPSLSILLALPTVPILLSLHPNSWNWVRSCQFFILWCLSPVAVLLITGFIIARPTLASEVLFSYLQQWSIYSTQIVPLIGLFYWPLILVAQVYLL